MSNKTSDAADGASDPQEVLLYSVLMASSGRLTVRELAGILQVDLGRLAAALSLAARLGFAKRMGDGGGLAVWRGWWVGGQGHGSGGGEECQGYCVGALPGCATHMGDSGGWLCREGGGGGGDGREQLVRWVMPVCGKRGWEVGEFLTSSVLTGTWRRVLGTYRARVGGQGVSAMLQGAAC